jgi:hypothetical protein
MLLNKDMKKMLTFTLLGALVLIVTNAVLAEIQALVFGQRADLELMWIFLMFTLLLFQWVFIIALLIFYAIRRKIPSNNFMLFAAIGSIISFAFYSFYWLGANQGDPTTLRLAIINSVFFGLIMEYMYRRIVIGSHADTKEGTQSAGSVPR